MDELAIACNLSPEELQERGGDLLPGLLELSDGQRPVEAGYVFSFPAPALPTVFKVIESERECCPFFRFEVTIEPAAGPVSLVLSGPSGTREFIEGFISVRT